MSKLIKSIHTKMMGLQFGQRIGWCLNFVSQVKRVIVLSDYNKMRGCVPWDLISHALIPWTTTTYP